MIRLSSGKVGEFCDTRGAEGTKQDGFETGVSKTEGVKVLSLRSRRGSGGWISKGESFDSNRGIKTLIPE